MAIKPFLKWAGGKRWLIERPEFSLPEFSGRYIEPFLGGAAIYFNVLPGEALLSDVNPKLIRTYQAIRNEWGAVFDCLAKHHAMHSKDYYYAQRSMEYPDEAAQAAHFLYLNRACWNGLYRENLKGEFNVPIGTKSKIVLETDDFKSVSDALQGAELRCCDFGETIDEAQSGDLVFVDPPYTTAHNMNGFVKYNQKIFSWEDQIRLRDKLVNAAQRGCKIVATNAWHESVIELYRGAATIVEVPRASVISGNNRGRKETSESLITMGA
ncbi:Dam family site-specific DNA-(adenine-N6)-methyltransferase [Agrobacterium rhizogenes]|nr:Dam family site-specific DNA-(adenine-N6)-methyltransferase [Rhizobium rhizogenes]NTI92461.1 Dam family site-specific DNA-(adenine-N6)-methyltransferase [Rhizobium rhizogenes]NTJ54928.1 Dam family site-specific DNA-(adenine-N6)-methyltransferase [Rhizobium rhizogenes]OCJ27080.1 DNA methyltransferase [Agrobacterium sp. B133/95]